MAAFADAIRGGVFLSTLPARGATNAFVQKGKWQKNFYPRSPRGERRVLQKNTYTRE